MQWARKVNTVNRQGSEWQKSKQWSHNAVSQENQNSGNATPWVRILTHCVGKIQNSGKSKQAKHANMWSSPQRIVYNKTNFTKKNYLDGLSLKKFFHPYGSCRTSQVTANQHIFKSNLTINFCQKQCLLVITWNEKHSLKQAVPITYTLEKSFLLLLLLKVCVVSFNRVKKLVLCFGLFDSSFNF